MSSYGTVYRTSVDSAGGIYWEPVDSALGLYVESISNGGTIISVPGDDEVELMITEPKPYYNPSILEAAQTVVFKEISESNDFGIACTKYGSVYFFGKGVSGVPGISSSSDLLLLPTLQNVVKVASGKSHIICLTADGSPYGWGFSLSGEVGVNNIAVVDTSVAPRVGYVGVPKFISTFYGRVVKDIACGDQHSLFLTDSGELYSTGDGSSGQLGLGRRSVRVPTRIDFSPDFHLSNVKNVVDKSYSVDDWTNSIRGIAAGNMHSAVITKSGTVYTFGLNIHGQLGVGDTITRYIPTRVYYQSNSASSDMVPMLSSSVSCGRSHTLFLLENGDVYAVGLGAHGRLGVSSPRSNDLNSPIPSVFPSDPYAFPTKDEQNERNIKLAESVSSENSGIPAHLLNREKYQNLLDFSKGVEAIWPHEHSYGPSLVRNLRIRHRDAVLPKTLRPSQTQARRDSTAGVRLPSGKVPGAQVRKGTWSLSLERTAAHLRMRDGPLPSGSSQAEMDPHLSYVELEECGTSPSDLGLDSAHEASVDAFAPNSRARAQRSAAERRKGRGMPWLRQRALGPAQTVIASPLRVSPLPAALLRASQDRSLLLAPSRLMRTVPAAVAASSSSSKTLLLVESGLSVEVALCQQLFHALQRAASVGSSLEVLSALTAAVLGVPIPSIPALLAQVKGGATAGSVKGDLVKAPHLKLEWIRDDASPPVAESIYFSRSADLSLLLRWKDFVRLPFSTMEAELRASSLQQGKSSQEFKESKESNECNEIRVFAVEEVIAAFLQKLKNAQNSYKYSEHADAELSSFFTVSAPVNGHNKRSQNAAFVVRIPPQRQPCLLTAQVSVRPFQFIPGGRRGELPEGSKLLLELEGGLLLRGAPQPLAGSASALVVGKMDFPTGALEPTEVAVYPAGGGGLVSLAVRGLHAALGCHPALQARVQALARLRTQNHSTEVTEDIQTAMAQSPKVQVRLSLPGCGDVLVDGHVMLKLQIQSAAQQDSVRDALCVFSDTPLDTISMNGQLRTQSNATPMQLDESSLSSTPTIDSVFENQRVRLDLVTAQVLFEVPGSLAEKVLRSSQPAQDMQGPQQNTPRLQLELPNQFEQKEAENSPCDSAHHPSPALTDSTNDFPQEVDLSNVLRLRSRETGFAPLAASIAVSATEGELWVPVPEQLNVSFPFFSAISPAVLFLDDSASEVTETTEVDTETDENIVRIEVEASSIPEDARLSLLLTQEDLLPNPSSSEGLVRLEVDAFLNARGNVEAVLSVNEQRILQDGPLSVRVLYNGYLSFEPFLVNDFSIFCVRARVAPALPAPAASSGPQKSIAWILPEGGLAPLQVELAPATLRQLGRHLTASKHEEMESFVQRAAQALLKYARLRFVSLTPSPEDGVEGDRVEYPLVSIGTPGELFVDLRGQNSSEGSLGNTPDQPQPAGPSGESQYSVPLNDQPPLNPSRGRVDGLLRAELTTMAPSGPASRLPLKIDAILVTPFDIIAANPVKGSKSLSPGTEVILTMQGLHTSLTAPAVQPMPNSASSGNGNLSPKKDTKVLSPSGRRGSVVAAAAPPRLPLLQAPLPVLVSLGPDPARLRDPVVQVNGLLTPDGMNVTFTLPHDCSHILGDQFVAVGLANSKMTFSSTFPVKIAKK